MPGALIGGLGAILLGLGAAIDSGWLDITGAVILAVGLVAALVLNHVTVEYDSYARLESLEKK